MPRKYDASSIKIIEDDRERLRKRPLTYIPSRQKEGAESIFFEIVDNSIDELTVRDSVGKTINASFDTKTKEMVVVDDGSGIPLEKLYEVCTIINSSGKFDNDENTAYTYSGGMNGVGLKAQTYLSKYSEITSMRDGKSLTYKFKDGILTDTIEGKTKEHGTTVKFILDPEFADPTDITPKDLVTQCQDKSYLFPSIFLNLNILNNGKPTKSYQFHGKDMTDWIEYKKPDTPIIEIRNDIRTKTLLVDIADDKVRNKKMIINLVFAYKEEALDSSDPMEYIASFGNTIRTTTGGTHVDGLKLGIQQYFKKDVIPNLKGKDKDLQIMPVDMTSGLCAFVWVQLSSPDFRGQFKDQLNNPEAKFAVRDAVYEALKSAKPSVTNPMIDFVKRVARGRLASKKTRKKDVGNAFSKDRLDKFIDITYNMDTVSPELVLCEGDSAQNCASTARDPHNQALYCVKKPANIYDDDSESVAKTVTVFNEILDICGLEPGKKCDPEKSTMKRILMLTDGDVDGDSIAISVMCLLAKHCKPLIDAGMVGRILPPAYAIPTGKNGKRVFVHTQREFFNTIMKKFVKEVTVAYKGKELSKQELYDLLSKNFVYDTKLQKLADRYCCDPKFMEYIAWKYHGDETTQKKSYWMNALKPFEDIHIYMEHSMIIIDGDLKGYDHINLSFDEYFNRHVNRFKRHQSANNDIYNFSINGEKDKSLYDVMKAMRKYIPNDVQRFKGLGELEPWEMKEFCMDCDHRNVVIMKFKDYESDMEKLNVIMSTKQAYVDARSRILRGISMSDLDLDT